MNASMDRFAGSLFLALAGILLAATPAGAQDAASLYKAKCVACHAADGKGNPSVAKQMGVRDFASPEVQNETDDQLAAIIAKGKNKMPAFGNSLKDPQIKDLVAYIRELAKKK
jgi:mono/diheme cytochrome c family protein